MRQVEGRFLQWVGHDVVLADIQVRPAVSVQEARVKIGGDDPAGAAHLLGQPQRDAVGPESDLQAVPALAGAAQGGRVALFRLRLRPCSGRPRLTGW